MSSEVGVTLVTDKKQLESNAVVVAENKDRLQQTKLNGNSVLRTNKNPCSVPSRTLEIKRESSPLTEIHIRELLAIEWQLDSLDFSSVDGNCIARFFDIRDAIAAYESLNGSKADENKISVVFRIENSAREYDEECRIVVRVEGYLKNGELFHNFSMYGAIRNIQDLPNVNVHKVVEFHDIRHAQEAIKALNPETGQILHAASVAYLERTRCKLFLIPPRLPSSTSFPESEHLKESMTSVLTNPKTLPLCTVKADSSSSSLLKSSTKTMTGELENSTLGPLQTSSPRPMHSLRDSSSSLASVANEQEDNLSIPYTLAKNITSLLDEEEAFQKPRLDSLILSLTDTSTVSNPIPNLFQNEELSELTMKEVLPSGLGLYDDDAASFKTSHPGSEYTPSMYANNGWEQPSSFLQAPYFANSDTQPSDNNSLFGMQSQDCQSSSLLSRLTNTVGISYSGENLGLNSEVSGHRDAMMLTQYVDELQRATLLQKLVNMEVLRRLNSLKLYSSSNGMIDSLETSQFPRNSEVWKKSEKTNRKKNARLNRRSSAMDIQQEAERRAQQEKMYALDLERVHSGQDKRTTLMIKNIPNKYTQRMLLARIEQDFKGTFDFFYLPIDFKNKCNVGYGFINMTKIDHIAPFVEHVHEQKWDKFNSDKICCVTYARIQGRNALVNHFRNSSLMLEESKHQPLLFDCNGDSEPFPMDPIM